MVGQIRNGLYQPAPVLVRRFKRILLGRPKRTQDAPFERLGVGTGLAVFFSDALSSVAYATEEILLVLVAAGAAATAYSLPIGLAIIVLILLVSSSYTQTIRAYPQGAGTYFVTRDNLGPTVSLVAAAALLVDYVMTVAVSTSAGVAAITSAVPALRGHPVVLALAAIAFIAWVNFRGVRESGTFFAVPTYGFLAVMFLLLGAGAWRVYQGNWHPVVDPRAFLPGDGWLPAVGGAGTWLLLRAFASGTTALTGIEAVSDGVRAFRAPEAAHAVRTMAIGRTILAVVFGGITLLAFGFSVVPREGETVLSQIAREVFGGGPLYYAVQIATMLILFLAANTAFSDFPRLLSFLAQDGYVTRRLANLGDTLVYSGGLAVLTLLSSLVVILFGASTHRLIPLYAVGVFTAFTLSQSGMVVHWLKERRRTGRLRLWPLLLNGAGALTTAVVLAVVTATKFRLGAWIVILVIAALVPYFLSVRDYYDRFLHRIRALERERMRIDVARQVKVVLAVGGLSPVIDHAMRVARRLSDDIVAVHVATDPEYGEKIRRKWDVQRHGGTQLVVLESPYRDVVGPLRHYLDELLAANPGVMVNLLVPVIVTNDPFDAYLHNATAQHILRELVYSEGVLITVIPFYVNMADENGGVLATYPEDAY